MVPVAPEDGRLLEFAAVTWLPPSRPMYWTPAGRTSVISSTLASNAEELEMTTV